MTELIVFWDIKPQLSMTSLHVVKRVLVKMAGEDRFCSDFIRTYVVIPLLELFH